MFAAFRRRIKDRRAARALYEAVVRQARTPVFYTGFGVPDTLDGRFELLCLHTALLTERALTVKGAGPGIAQGLFDALFRDMERNLREIGVGDLSVPRQMRRMMTGFNGRAARYRAALAAGDETALLAALHDNLYGTVSVADAAQVVRMADYVRRCAARLATQPATALVEGWVVFATPEPGQDMQEDQADGVGMAA